MTVRSIGFRHQAKNFCHSEGFIPKNLFPNHFSKILHHFVVQNDDYKNPIRRKLKGTKSLSWILLHESKSRTSLSLSFVFAFATSAFRFGIVHLKTISRHKLKGTKSPKKNAAHGGCQTWGGCKRYPFTFLLSLNKKTSLMKQNQYHSYE